MNERALSGSGCVHADRRIVPVLIVGEHGFKERRRGGQSKAGLLLALLV
jgi:hypothetical protein